MLRPIIANRLGWAVVSYFDSDSYQTINAFGNGAEFQLPIFPTLAEARAWKRSHYPQRGNIVRVKITRYTKGGKEAA